jgi:DNA-binding HxlR family transcriptional regulator
MWNLDDRRDYRARPVKNLYLSPWMEARNVACMIDYGQFCTVARGAEVFGERWTPLVVRELLCGSTRFNDIRRGVPRMSATLLAQRLRKLEQIGVVKRVGGQTVREYRLTPAGEELRPIVLGLGHWGARWIGGRLAPGQLDAGFLMWDIRRFARLDEFPRNRRIVIHFRLHDARPREREWWLVVERGVADLCRDDPGHELTLIVDSSVRALTEIWTGDREAAAVLRTKELRITGPAGDAAQLWTWLGRSVFAETRAGRDAAMRAAA